VIGFKAICYVDSFLFNHRGKNSDTECRMPEDLKSGNEKEIFVFKRFQDDSFVTIWCLIWILRIVEKLFEENIFSYWLDLMPFFFVDFALRINFHQMEKNSIDLFDFDLRIFKRLPACTFFRHFCFFASNQHIFKTWMDFASFSIKSFVFYSEDSNIKIWLETETLFWSIVKSFNISLSSWAAMN